MHQFLAEIAYETYSGTKVRKQSFYLPSTSDVRAEVAKTGGYLLSVHRQDRSTLERIIGKSSWWQVQLLRGIQFRSTATSPGVALWKLINSETSPTRQNILAPAREALARGMGAIDALRALNIFDRGTLAILSASDRANKLQDGIPHAIQSITQKQKNARAIMGTLGWLGFDIFSIVSSLQGGKGFIMDWFEKNQPTEPAKLEEFKQVTRNLNLVWDVLLGTAYGLGIFMAWCMFSFFINRGKRDWPTARVVRKIPLIGGYLKDLGFADSMAAASRMIKGNVPIGETLIQSSEATNVPDVSAYWVTCWEQLQRGMALGSALDRAPLSRSERMELSTLSDLGQVATIMDSIAELRAMAAKGKHAMIVWVALAGTGLYLAIGMGSAIYALTVMNMSMDSMMGGVLGGEGGGGSPLDALGGAGG